MCSLGLCRYVHMCLKYSFNKVLIIASPQHLDRSLCTFVLCFYDIKSKRISNRHSCDVYIRSECGSCPAEVATASRPRTAKHDYRPLSRRLDRCDRVIQKESGDPNGGNMCSFSRVRHNAHYVPYAQIRFDL